MPATLYLVGSDKPYTTIQAAIDAVILDYLGTLTADVEVRTNAGETFTDNGFTDLVIPTGLLTNGYRLTLAGADPNTPSIIDMADNGATRFFWNGGQTNLVQKFTIRGYKVINNANNAHTIIGTNGGSSGKNGGSIIERCDFEVRSRLGYATDGSSLVDSVLWRNNYIHGRAGGFYSDFPFNSVYFNRFVGNTFRRVDKAFTLDFANGAFESFDNIFVDVGINVIEGSGSLAQFNAHWTANGNLYFGTPPDFLSLYSVPAVYTLAQYRAFASGPDATVVTADPLLLTFADPHVGVGSPAIGAGVANANLGTDAYGFTRSDPPTIGLYEFARAVLYTVGAGKMFSVLQAAWDAMMSDYGSSVTTDVEIVLSNGEVFTGTGVPALLTNGTVTGANRVTVRGQELSLGDEPEIASTAGTAIELHTRHVTFLGLMPHGLSGAGGRGITDFIGDGVVYDSCQVPIPGDCEGLSLADSAGTPSEARNNFLYFTGGSSNDRVAIRMNSTTKAYNNTVLGTKGGVYAAPYQTAFKLGPSRAGFDIENNIIDGVDYGIDGSAADASWLTGGGGSTFDYNDFFEVSYFGASPTPAYFSTLATWRTATGMEANSIEADPMVTSPTDPHLLRGSPAIDAGVTIPSVTEDFLGDPRGALYDIGCDEFRASGAVMTLILGRRRRTR